MRACAIIPAFDAARTVAGVVEGVAAVWPEPGAVFVVDDGSTDGTAALAREAGARVLVHPRNRGKGAALRTGMEAALAAGFDAAVTVDADGQHPADQAARLLEIGERAPEGALVLGVRDLAGAGAPRKNQVSNRISNFFLSLFSGRRLADTQCGLRRYPLPATLELDGRGDGYAYEAEIILRALAAGVPLAEVPVSVYYPPESERVTHFDSVRDPARIVGRVVEVLIATRGMRRSAARRRSAEVVRGAAPRPKRSAPERAREL